MCRRRMGGAYRATTTSSTSDLGDLLMRVGSYTFVEPYFGDGVHGEFSALLRELGVAAVTYEVWCLAAWT